MDLNAFLIDGVVTATTPPDERPAAAEHRRAAINEMFRGYAPADAMQSMVACQCIALQFMLNTAIRDAGADHFDPAAASRARGGATAISKTLLQWVTKFERLKRQAEAVATEAAAATAHRAKPGTVVVVESGAGSPVEPAPVQPAPVQPAPIGSTPVAVAIVPEAAQKRLAPSLTGPAPVPAAPVARDAVPLHPDPRPAGDLPPMMPPEVGPRVKPSGGAVRAAG